MWTTPTDAFVNLYWMCAHAGDVWCCTHSTVWSPTRRSKHHLLDRLESVQVYPSARSRVCMSHAILSPDVHVHQLANCDVSERLNASEQPEYVLMHPTLTQQATAEMLITKEGVPGNFVVRQKDRSNRIFAHRSVKVRMAKHQYPSNHIF